MHLALLQFHHQEARSRRSNQPLLRPGDFPGEPERQVLRRLQGEESQFESSEGRRSEEAVGDERRADRAQDLSDAIIA